jgi:hypothetical protein
MAMLTAVPSAMPRLEGKQRNEDVAIDRIDKRRRPLVWAQFAVLGTAAAKLAPTGTMTRDRLAKADWADEGQAVIETGG